MNETIRPSVNPAQVEGAVRALKTANADGSAVAMIDGIGMTIRVHPAMVDRMLALGYRRA